MYSKHFDDRRMNPRHTFSLAQFLKAIRLSKILDAFIGKMRQAVIVVF